MSMSGRLVGIMILAFAQLGCGGNYSPRQLHRTVQPHPNREGIYLVYYLRHQMIDEYGPGVAAVREAVRQANDIDEKLAIWERALADAVPRYLNKNGLIPAECANGIEVVDSSGQERGAGGTTAFRCK